MNKEEKKKLDKKNKKAEILKKLAALEAKVSQEKESLGISPPVEKKDAVKVSSDSPSTTSTEELIDSPSTSEYHISENDKIKYQELFRQLDTKKQNCITQDVLVSVLTRFGLTIVEIAKIWAICDVSLDDFLAEGEFVIAMAIVDRKLHGVPIPESLPIPLLAELNNYNSPSVKKKTTTGFTGVDELLDKMKNVNFESKSDEDHHKAHDHNHDHSILFLVSQQTRRLSMLIAGITDSARSFFTFKDIRCPSEDDQYKGQTLTEIKRRNYNIICVVITKGTFQDTNLVDILTQVEPNKIVLLHDLLSTTFPKVDEQPLQLRHAGIFDRIALTLIEGYYNIVWNKLESLCNKEARHAPEDISTTIFLSHIQRTGQGIATTLYSQLDKFYPNKVFLDVQAKFELHKLEEIVKSTELFVFILTEDIFDSYWCRKEWEAAYGLKPILIIRNYAFQIPTVLPPEWEKYRSDLHTDNVIYAANVLEECVKQITDRIDKLRKNKKN